MTQFIPVILSGGSGTRLWPISRTHFPKQFAEIFDESLMAKTIKRLQPLGSPWVITNLSMRILTETVLDEMKIPQTQAIYETRANNTAPAIALLCKIFEMNGKSNAVVGIFPSDHLLQNEKTFQAAIALGIECALKKQVVTLGIKPTYPATGYGYIEVNKDALFATQESSGVTLQAKNTKGFREKPDHKTAQEFVSSGNFFWNAGMFIFEVATLSKHFQNLMPQLSKELNHLKPDLSNLNEVYNSIASPAHAKSCAISFDYGIMEKLKEQVCIPCDIDWNDVGSWDEIIKLGPTSPQIEVAGSKNNYTFSKNAEGASQKIVSFVGVEDLIVVDTADALLITKKGASQEVKSVVDALKKMDDARAHKHMFEFRPWGKYEILRDTNEFKTKIIHVNPGHQISYQSHNKRSEHWVIIKGNPEVILNEVTHKLKPGENIYIPQGTKHRIRNTSTSDIVEFVEVQVGTYFGEDDIIRYQDDYNRN